MKKMKRILALAAVVLLAGMYVLTLIFALMKSEHAQAMFRGALGCTILIPVLLYLILMVARSLHPHKSPVIDVLIFDVGKVLLDFPWEEHYDNMAVPEKDRDRVRRIISSSPLWDEFDLNNEPYEVIAGKIAALVPEYADAIKEMIMNVDDCVSIFWYTEDLLKALRRQGYKAYYLSNWNHRWTDRLLARGVPDIRKMTDGGIWSCDIHKSKPDPAIYNALFERYHITPSRAVFIDDSEENVKAAQKLGCAGIVFTGYNDLCEKLDSLGCKGLRR